MTAAQVGRGARPARAYARAEACRAREESAYARARLCTAGNDAHGASGFQASRDKVSAAKGRISADSSFFLALTLHCRYDTEFHVPPAGPLWHHRFKVSSAHGAVLKTALEASCCSLALPPAGSQLGHDSDSLLCSLVILARQTCVGKSLEHRPHRRRLPRCPRRLDAAPPLPRSPLAPFPSLGGQC